MRVDQLSLNLIDQLRAWFHPKDRHLYLSDDQWIISRRVAWETAVSKFQNLPGLVGFWPMSSVQRSTGQAYDLSGQARHLTYNGNAQYTIYNDIIPYINLDGTGDYLSRADETDLDIQGNETIYAAGVRGLTLGGWFWLDALTGGTVTRGFINKFLTTGSQRSYTLILTTATPQDGVRFAVSQTGSATLAGVNSVETLATGAWYFLVGRFVPSVSVDVYVNGSKTSETASIPSSVFASTAAFEIGRFNENSSAILAGRATLCFVCANALPDTLISMLYEQSRKLFGV